MGAFHCAKIVNAIHRLGMEDFIRRNIHNFEHVKKTNRTGPYINEGNCLCLLRLNYYIRPWALDEFSAISTENPIKRSMPKEKKWDDKTDMHTSLLSLLLICCCFFSVRIKKKGHKYVSCILLTTQRLRFQIDAIGLSIVLSHSRTPISTNSTTVLYTALVHSMVLYAFFMKCHVSFSSTK